MVAMYVRDYMTANGLHELLQSAYKKVHSTDIALVWVQDALLRACDNHQAAVIMLLDSSAAFDTVKSQYSDFHSRNSHWSY